MDIEKKLAILADAAKYDASCSSGGGKQKRSGPGLGSTQKNGICHSYTPDGRCISLLKILMTNFCMYDCKYCVNRISSDIRRARFTTDEIVKLTIDFYKRNYIEGLFLSSGIIRDSDYTMDQLVRVAKSLRNDHSFKGYIHLKTIPGASQELVTEAGLYADRLSINIELPTAPDLALLAPEKKRDELEGQMHKIKTKALEMKNDRKNGFKKVPLFNPAGQSTQMIIGATPTPDKDILITSSTLYEKYNLRRVYYSAFSPIPHGDARLPLINPPLIREHRLYQADWLLRFYDYKVDEIVDDKHPTLDLNVDPKVSWAVRHPEFFPIDINTAPRQHLLRVPGFGVRSVDKMMRIRKHQKLRLQDLTKMRVALNRARPFIITPDYKPSAKLIDAPMTIHQHLTMPEQLTLFA